MYRRLPEGVRADDAVDRLAVSIDGQRFPARRGDTVAATLLASGLDACRTTAVNGVPRGPYCMMGVCFDCLVSIDGRPNLQGCMIAVADGMRIETQQGAREVGIGVGDARASTSAGRASTDTGASGMAIAGDKAGA